MENNLSGAFRETLNSSLITCVNDIAEASIDTLLEDGFLKNIPLINVATSLYGIGHSIKGKFNIKKLARFIDAINKQISSEEDRKKYQNKFHENETFRNREIEYLLILIDRYVHYDKPGILAKLYLSYLNLIIDWKEFCAYAEILDRIILFDLEVLISKGKCFILSSDDSEDTYLRLEALGLIKNISLTSPYEKRGTGRITMTLNSVVRYQFEGTKYQRTEFGEKFVLILQ